MSAADLLADGPIPVKFRRADAVEVEIIDPSLGWPPGTRVSARLKGAENRGAWVTLGALGDARP